MSFHNLHYFISFFKFEVYLFSRKLLAAFEYTTLNAENVARRKCRVNHAKDCTSFLGKSHVH